MLNKRNTLSRMEVERVFKYGKYVGGKSLYLRYETKKGERGISFVVPKKEAKRSTQRNLLRRRGYPLISKHFSSLPEGFMGVFVFGKESQALFGGKKKKNYNPILELEGEIKRIIEKL